MPGTAYVLFHHVMGETNGKRGVWGYVRGGMGGLTQALAQAAQDLGVEIRTEAEVARILVKDGPGGRRGPGRTATSSPPPWSPATPTPTSPSNSCSEPSTLPPDFAGAVDRIDYDSASLKINVALSELPDFTACPARSPARSTAAPFTSVPTRTTSSAPTTTPSTAGPRSDRFWNARSRPPSIRPLRRRAST